MKNCSSICCVLARNISALLGVGIFISAYIEHRNSKSGFQSFLFNSETNLRAIEVNGDPRFVALDVCRALSLSNITVAISPSDPDERQGEGWIINESGLYALIFSYRDAVIHGTVPHRFRKWVTSEVLPAIHKTGKFKIDQTAETERLKADVDRYCKRYDCYKVKVSRQHKRGEDIPRANAANRSVEILKSEFEIEKNAKNTAYSFILTNGRLTGSLLSCGRGLMKCVHLREVFH